MTKELEKIQKISESKRVTSIVENIDACMTEQFLELGNHVHGKEFNEYAAVINTMLAGILKSKMNLTSHQFDEDFTDALNVFRLNFISKCEKGYSEAKIDLDERMKVIRDAMNMIKKLFEEE